MALTMYSILPVLRNTITGLASVDPAVVEAARGMGMSERQILWRVQFPLAAPVIAAGIRTAAVWTVGAATLATPVGQRCLGNFIFAGLQTRNWAMVIWGVIAAAGLAIILDSAIGAVESSLRSRKRTRALSIAAALAAAVGLGLALPALSASSAASPPPPAPQTSGGPSASQGAPAAPDAPPLARVRLGAKTFSEQYILVAAMRSLLTAQGIQVDVAESLGSTVVFDALKNGDIDAYVDYSGTIWANHMKREVGPPRWEVLAEVNAWLAREHGIRSLGSLGFENAYAFTVRRETADKLHLQRISDLTARAQGLTVGSDYELFGRPEWANVESAYGLRFAKKSSFDSALMYEALLKSEIDVLIAFSSDGRISAHDLVTLDDPRGALPPYDAILLLGPKAARDARVVCALQPLRDAIPVRLMREANYMVDRDTDKRTPDAAARELLERAGVKPRDCNR
ncbi:MAG: ABC transporter permease/substrate-binding protein [Polyangiaceae bacterium]